jgi:hypothetical protein
MNDSGRFSRLDTIERLEDFILKEGLWMLEMMRLYLDHNIFGSTNGHGPMVQMTLELGCQPFGFSPLS